MLTEHIKEHEILGTSKDISDLKTSQVEQDLRIQATETHAADAGIHVTPAWKLAMEAKSAVYYRATIAERDAITGVKEGDICRVGNDGTGKFASYIYSSSASWEILSKQDWENLNITWAAIVDKPDIPTFLGYTFANRTTDPAAPAAGYLTMFFKGAVAYVKDAAGSVASFATMLGAATETALSNHISTLGAHGAVTTDETSSLDGEVMLFSGTTGTKAKKSGSLWSTITGAISTLQGYFTGGAAKSAINVIPTQYLGTAENAIDAIPLMANKGNGEYVVNYGKGFPAGANDPNVYECTASGCIGGVYAKIVARLRGTKTQYEGVYNNSTWSGWTQLTDASGNAVNANSLGGKTYAQLFDANGNARRGNIAIDAFSGTAGANKSLAAQTCNIPGRFTCLDRYLTDSPAGWPTDVHAYITHSGDGWSSVQVWEPYVVDDLRSWKRTVSNTGTTSGWTQLTDAYGNAVNANSLGGVAAASYALKTDTAPDSSKLGGKTYATLFDASGKAIGLYRGASSLQSSAMTNDAPNEMYYDGFAEITVNVTGSAKFSLEDIPWHYLSPYSGMAVVTIPVRKGQKIKVTCSGFNSAAYTLFAPLS